MKLFSVVVFLLISFASFSQGEPVSVMRKSPAELKSIYAVDKLSEKIELNARQKEDLVYVLAEYLEQLNYSPKEDKVSLQNSRNKSAKKILKEESKFELFNREIDTFLFPQKNYKR